MKRLFAALWIIAILVGTGLSYWQEDQFPAQQERESMLISVVGEFRTVLARYLFFKMDIFHEVMEEKRENREQDAQLMPLLRMITLLDPSMTDSYDQIVWEFQRKGELQTARAILEEGIERNPKSYQLRFRKALMSYQEKEYKKTQEFALEALRLAPGPVTQADSLRLLYWASDKLEARETQRRALHDLLKLRPKDPLWNQERERLKGLL